MSREPAPLGVDPALIDRRSGQPRKISKRLQEAIRLIETGSVRTIKAAAERAGLSYNYLVEALRKPATEAFIAQKRRQNVTAASLRASSRAMELVDAESEHVSAEMTLKLLAIEGIKPDNTARIAVNVDVRAGYVIDLSGAPDPREPSVQIEHRVGPSIDALPQRQPPRRVVSSPVPSFSPPAPAPVDTSYRPEQQADDQRQAEAERESGQGSGSRALPRRDREG